MMNKENTRIEWIDFVRTIAIVFVVLCHSTESIYQLNLEGMNSLPLVSRIFGLTCFTIGRLGVPLFLMITGSLLLSRDYDYMSIRKFWKKWVHLLICTIIWFVIYDIFLTMNNHATSINFLQLLEELFFLRNVNMAHVWYLPTILGLYILLPFVSSILKKYDKRMFIFPLLIYTLYSFGFYSLNLVYSIHFPEMPLSNLFSSGFSGAYYGLYIVYGYYISENTFKKIPSLYVFLIFLSTFISIIYIQNWFYENSYGYNVWYTDLFLLLASMALYELASRIKKVFGYKVIKKISIYSFGIYLIHDIIKTIFADSIKSLGIIKPFRIILLWAICISASIIVTIIISKIPKVGKYILYMK